MFSNGSYLKIWEVKAHEKYTEVRATTSKKKEDGTYDQDFNAWVRLVGAAHKQGVKEKDSLRIKNCGVTNTYDKEKKVTYTNYLVFAFEDGAESGGAKTSEKPIPESFNNIPEGTTEEALPF